MLSAYWCRPENISNSEIESQISQYAVNVGNTPENIFLSPDLYSSLLKTMFKQVLNPQNFGGRTMISSWWSSMGQVNVQLLKRYKCFLFVGSKEELHDYISNGVPLEFLSEHDREFIDRHFEDIILTS